MPNLSRSQILCRDLLRHKVNPRPRGRPRERDGYATHRTSRWEETLVHHLDTERALNRLGPDGRVILLLVNGGGYSIPEVAFILSTSERIIRLLLHESEAAFEAILDAGD